MGNVSTNIHDPAIGAAFWARVADAVVAESTEPSDDRVLVERLADRLGTDEVHVPAMVAVAWERDMFVDRRRQRATPQLSEKARWLLDRVGHDDGRQD